MFRIILFILKILGILLPVILGVFLLLLLTVLLVPVRYRGEGSWYGRPKGIVRITWLLHLISLKAVYEEQFKLTVRLFGIPLFRLRGREEEKEPDGQERSGPQEREAEDALEAILDDGEEELILSAQELEDGSGDGAYTGLSKADAGFGGFDRGSRGQTGSGRKKRKRKGFFKRIREKLSALRERLKAAALGLMEKIKGLDQKREELLAFLGDEENQKTFRLLKRQLLRLLKHVRPTRLKGHITFGLGDPYAMGQALSAAGFFYPLYGRQLVLTPVFDGKIIEGELRIRGRIRAGVFAFAAIRILLNRNFRKQLKRLLS